MDFNNSTTYPDYFLRRLLSFCMKETGVKKSQLRRIDFRKRTYGHRSGRCWWGRHERRILIKIQRDGDWPITPFYRRGIPNWECTPEQSIVMITAHELIHLRDGQDGSMKRLDSKGSRRANVERRAEHGARLVMIAFVERERELVNKWWDTPRKVASVAIPNLTLQEKRAAKVATLLDKWERKAKAAQKKVKAYRAKARYYENALAKKASE